MRKLGKVQIAVLRCLIQHKGWRRRPYCGWVWDHPSGTQKVLDSLVKLELVSVTDGFYEATNLGCTVAFRDVVENDRRPSPRVHANDR